MTSHSDPSVPAGAHATRPTSSQRFVQACIAPVSFPLDREHLLDMLDPTPEGCELTNLQWLVDGTERTDDDGWTVPRWMAPGDVVLFYHAKKALRRIVHHLTETWREAGGRADLLTFEQEDIIERLERERGLALAYGGTIFACARVAGRPAADRSPEERARRKHWRGSVYAPIRDVRVFERPMPDAEFRRYITLGTGGGPTPLHGSAFEALRDGLARANRLPSYLSRARGGGPSFRDVTRATWRAISCRPDARFLDEEQLRDYLANYLLAEAKDPGTPIHEECVFGGHGVGPRADYVVRIDGVWTSVETKVNVLTESDPVWQVARYVSASGFLVTRGRHQGQRTAHVTGPRCLLIDADGVYVANAEGFVRGAPGRPALKRTALANLDPAALRTQIRALLASRA